MDFSPRADKSTKEDPICVLQTIKSSISVDPSRFSNNNQAVAVADEEMAASSRAKHANCKNHLAATVRVKKVHGSGSIYQYKAGRWKAEIQIRNVRHRLGTYSTAEDAEEALSRKRQELGLTDHTEQNSISMFQAAAVSDEEMAASLPAKHANCKNHPAATVRVKKVHGSGCVYQYKPGSWKAEIQVRKVRHRLGTYSTAEDAEEALSRKRQELGLTDHTEQSVFQHRTYSACQKKSVLRQTEMRNPKAKIKCRLGTHDGEEDAEEAPNRKRYSEQTEVSQGKPHHAYQKKSGRWQTEIRNPITKVRIHLGTYDTAEEAQEAYNKKRSEFDLMVHARKKQKQSSVGCKGDGEQSKNAIVVVEGKSDLTTVSDEPFVSADGSLVIKTVEEEEVGGNMISENVENMQMPYVESRGECYLDIINSNGQLVGEYSRLDDELWLCNYDDYDYDDDDATIGRDQAMNVEKCLLGKDITSASGS